MSLRKTTDHVYAATSVPKKRKKKPRDTNAMRYLIQTAVPTAALNGVCPQSAVRAGKFMAGSLAVRWAVRVGMPMRIPNVRCFF